MSFGELLGDALIIVRDSNQSRHLWTAQVHEVKVHQDGLDVEIEMRLTRVSQIVEVSGEED